ncbi:MAG: gliding motility-associated-like protein, partial [Sediminicola sp.]
VFNVNDTPNFNTTPILIATQNKTYQLELIVEDIDKNDSYTLTFLVQPAWLSIIDNKFLTGIPLKDDVDLSPFAVSIMVTDDAGTSDTLTYILEVFYENNSPTIDPLPSSIILVEDNLETQTIPLTGITNGGENNQIIEINYIIENEALFEVFDIEYVSPNTSGIIRYRLRENAFGESKIILEVKDNGPEDINRLEKIFLISVEPVNDIPYFTSDPIVKAAVNENYSYIITYKDEDTEDVLAISITDGPEWLTISTIDNNSALLSGEIPTTATSESITLKIEDLDGASTTQSFNIQINSQPTISNIVFTLFEDSNFEINSELINLIFNDADQGLAVKLKLNWGAGIIKNKGENLSKDEEILIDQDLILTYTAPQNYVGRQTITIAISDEFIFSEPGKINIDYEAVNDAPVLGNIEVNSLEYIQGDQPIQITETITISDVDNLEIDSAFIFFNQNYNAEDDMLLLDSDISGITATFDQLKGILVISGTSSKSNYEQILQSIKYVNRNELSTDTDLKQISFTVSDSINLSEEISRDLLITEVLPELAIVNAFTPNNDGVNDTWDFTNLNQFENILIQIYNQDRRIIYQCKSTDCEWDGTYNGQQLSAGPYFYSIQLNNGRRIYEGLVTILK